MPKSIRDYLRLKPHPADNREVPNWHEDGDHLIRIEHDPIFVREWAAWQDAACKHNRRGIVELRDALDRPMFAWLCRRCGYRISEFIPHGMARSFSEGQLSKDEVDAKRDWYGDSRKRELKEIISRAIARQT